MDDNSYQSKEEITKTRKRIFAYSLYGGHSVSESAIAAGYSKKSARQRGNQLKNDPEVISFLNQIKHCRENGLPLPQIGSLSDGTTEERAKSEIATVEEVMKVFTKILRQELTNDTVVVVTNTENKLMGQARTSEAQVIQTRADIRDVINAGDKILKYQSMFENPDSKASGVVILPEIIEE